MEKITVFFIKERERECDRDLGTCVASVLRLAVLVSEFMLLLNSQFHFGLSKFGYVCGLCHRFGLTANPESVPTKVENNR